MNFALSEEQLMFRDLFREEEARKHIRKSMFCWGFVLVDLKGFEPLTSSMPWKRAPNCATGPLG